MDLKTNKDVVGVGVGEEDELSDSTAPNVHSLKMFFQNQKQPIIRFQQNVDNICETSSTPSSQSQPKAHPIDSTASYVLNRTNRVIPRPPKQIQSLDIKVSPFFKSLVSNQCERAVPPVPKPRKSLQNRSHGSLDNYCSEVKQKCVPNDVIKRTIDDNQRSNSLILSLTKELNQLNIKERNSRTHSLHNLSKLDQNIESQTLDSKMDYFCGQTIDETLVGNNCESIEVKSVEKERTDKQSSSKSKKHFKSFLKRSKLLSLRKKSDKSIGKQRKVQTNSDPNISQTKPIKPTRSPPAPPVLHFRPAAPLPTTEPNEDYYEDTLSTNNSNHFPNGYELYNDSVESEQIYCSLDNEDQSDDDFYEGINHYDDGLTRTDRHSYITDNLYEESVDNYSDCDRIYEVLPFERDLQTDSDSNASNASTISLDALDNNPIESQAIPAIDTQNNSKFEQKFNRKRNLKAIKLKKKFNLMGDEIPVNAGVVKEDNRGNAYDLYVRKGETVLILRMEGNPPGKWLAKNERSKVGFVDLDNISFDAESVKSIIKTFASNKTLNQI